MRREIKSLRNGVHHADGVAWEPVVVHARVHERPHEQAVAHHELRDHVERPVLPPPVVRRLRLPRAELLPQLAEVQRRGLAAVVGVSVHV
eukprot:30228-Pelagococcus_subviridis.AAC.4